MLVLDENMPDSLLETLQGRGSRVVKIGKSVGRASMTDADIIPLLHQLRAATFFTFDRGYCRPQLCHSRYCLVFIRREEESIFGLINGVLRHSAFRTWAQRRGKLIWARKSGIRVWTLNQQTYEDVPWE